MPGQNNLLRDNLQIDLHQDKVKCHLHNNFKLDLLLNNNSNLCLLLKELHKDLLLLKIDNLLLLIDSLLLIGNLKDEMDPKWKA